MPWYVAQSKQCPADKPWAVIKKSDGKLAGCHESALKARQQQKALYAAEGKK